MEPQGISLRHDDGAEDELDRPRVLVADDDGPTRLLLRRVLGGRGFDVREVDDGAAALAAVAAEDLDVLLLDVGLPDMSGLEVLRRLRRETRTATLPVVLLTGRAHPADRVQGFEAGASDYLTKPIDLDELVVRVQGQVRGRRLWRSQVAEALHRRATLAGTLASIPEDLPPEEVAHRVVTALLDLGPVRSVGFVHLTGAGEGRLLAGTHLAEHGMAAGQPLPAEVVVAILEQTGEPDPLLGRAALLPQDRGQRRFPGLVGNVMAAVLGSEPDPWGILLIETGSNEGEALRRVGVATADLLPVIDRVLGPPLARWSAQTQATDLAEVIERRAFTPHYQPIVDLRDGTVVGYEALTRFHDGTRPDLRFAQAGRAGLGLDLERVTLEAAIGHAARLPDGAFLSVNVSASFVVGGLLPSLGAPLEGRPLVLEVTEHEQVEDYAALQAAVDALGPDVRLSVDDAGSGWSSLRHVFALKPDFVKLDWGWVNDLDLDPARQALLLGIAQFAALSGGSVIAEGIETTAELRTLRRLGIPLGQGFLLGYPEPVEAHLDRRRVALPVGEERAAPVGTSAAGPLSARPADDRRG
jgi:EAL domain-containing protein (putative c-di-GMP-specific phosphodiesterase class I)/DNA-binding NarL/FixJ family response regulator